MQIFVTNSDPSKAAERLWKNPLRARKMITETQQILAVCQEKFFGKISIVNRHGNPIGTSHHNHPCIIWAKADLSHMKWLHQHLIHLYRFYVGEGFENVGYNLLVLGRQLKDIPCVFNSIEFLNLATSKAKGLDFTKESDVFLAYDKYLSAQGA